MPAPRKAAKKTAAAPRRSAIDEIAAGLETDPDDYDPDEEQDVDGGPDEETTPEAPDHSMSQLFIGDDSVEIKISHTVTVAGKDHFVGTTTNYRALPGETQYELGERAADFALELNFAVANQFRDMKLHDIAERKRAAAQQ